MYRFQKTQVVFRIGGLDFGGQPGKRKTVMMCPLRSQNDLDSTAMSIVREVVSTIGVPVTLLIEATNFEDTKSCLDLASGLEGIPIVMDPTDVAVKTAGLIQAEDLGLMDRVVCGGLSLSTSVALWDKLREIGVKAAILRSANPNDETLKGRIYALENGGGVMEEGLLERAKSYGITQSLLDTGGPGPGGSGLRALLVAKAKWGLPCGCDLREIALRSNGGSDLESTTTALSQAAGADFVFAGPPDSWMSVARRLAFADSLIERAVAEM